MLVVKYFLKHYTRMYDTYNKMSDIFVEPTLRFRFGLWKNDPHLPVYRRGLFHIFNWDVRTKSDEYGYSSYEFPPQFTIVFFGISMTWWLEPPMVESPSWFCEYWESLEDCMYLYGKDINKYFENCPASHVLSSDEWNDTYVIPCRPEYLKNQKPFYTHLQKCRLNNPGKTYR